MRKKVTIISSITILLLFIISFIMLGKSYSYGIYMNVEGKKGSRIIKYYDSTLDSELSFDEAYTYYGIKKYDYQTSNGETVYFYRGKEISKNEYIKGSASEEADTRASLYGNSAYRVHSTAEFNKAFDDIYNNLKIGEFRIEFSPYENINLNEVKSYFDSKYGLTNYKQNWYPYSKKGIFEPEHFGLDISGLQDTGELILDTDNILISGNERVVLENFVNRILPYLKPNGSDYEKIAATFKLLQRAEYLVDNGFWNDALASNTSAYDALINRKTTCIGYSIGFSYIMDKMGIESYIVDDIIAIDKEARTFSSVHTWNIVKLNNVFYKVDITGNSLLKAVSYNEVKECNLPLSNSDYPNAYNVSIDNNSIDKILNDVKTIKTTTTRAIKPTTTTKTYPYEKPNINKTTSNKTNITTKDKQGNTYEIVTDEVGNTHTVKKEEDKPSAQIVTTTNHPNKNPKAEKKANINLNYILIPLVIILIVFLIGYKIKNKHLNKK